MVAHKSVTRKRRITKTMSRDQAHSYLMNLAALLNVDVRESDIEETKRVLSKGKPLSVIVKEMRGR